MRLFVAVPLSADARAALAAAAARLRRELPPARWVPEEQLHVTLWFHDPAPDGVVPDFVAELRRTFSGVASFVTALDGAGTFPPGRGARVAWVGLREAPEWATLAAAASAAGEALGLPGERRPFTPHVTVARARRPWPRGAAARWKDGFQGALGGEFPVRAAALVRSQLAADGARHEILAELALGAR